MRRFLIFLLILCLPQGAFAIDPAEVLSDATLESRARALFLELRCVQCQSESIAESQADIAKDLRLLVRERLIQGDSDAQALEYIAQRYGDYVLLRPRMQGGALILWFFAPFLFIVTLFVLFIRFYIRREGVPSPLTQDEESEISSLLKH